MKQAERRKQIIIQGILDIHHRLLNKMDDLELTAMIIRAHRLEAAKPGETEVMDTVDIGFLGEN